MIAPIRNQKHICFLSKAAILPYQGNLPWLTFTPVQIQVFTTAPLLTWNLLLWPSHCHANYSIQAPTNHRGTVKQVRVWSKGSMGIEQDCFEHKDLDTFMAAITYNHHTMVDEYAITCV